MSETRTVGNDDDDSDDPNLSSSWTSDRIAQLKCVVREDGKKSHVFLDYSNKCQCGVVDLNAYRGMELRCHCHGDTLPAIPPSRKRRRKRKR